MISPVKRTALRRGTSTIRTGGNSAIFGGNWTVEIRKTDAQHAEIRLVKHLDFPLLSLDGRDMTAAEFNQHAEALFGMDHHRVMYYHPGEMARPAIEIMIAEPRTALRSLSELAEHPKCKSGLAAVNALIRHAAEHPAFGKNFSLLLRIDGDFFEEKPGATLFDTSAPATTPSRGLVAALAACGLGEDNARFIAHEPPPRFKEDWDAAHRTARELSERRAQAIREALGESRGRA